MDVCIFLVFYVSSQEGERVAQPPGQKKNGGSKWPLSPWDIENGDSEKILCIV